MLIATTGKERVGHSDGEADLLPQLAKLAMVAVMAMVKVRAKAKVRVRPKAGVGWLRPSSVSQRRATT